MRFRNRLDENIEFSETIGQTAEYLDIRLENIEGRLVSEVYNKLAHEPYFHPFTSVHNEHIKRNIPFGARIRAIRYSSTYNAFKREEAHICMALLLNKYPMVFILEQLERVPRTFQCTMPTRKNYSEIGKIFLDVENKDGRKDGIDFEVRIHCHFSFCQGMLDFSTCFHQLCNDCFADTLICKMKQIVGSKRLRTLKNIWSTKKRTDHCSWLLVNQQHEGQITNSTLPSQSIMNGCTNDHHEPFQLLGTIQVYSC